MELKLCVNNYGRPRVDLPQTRLVNAYVESSPGGPSEAIRTMRPGLSPVWTLGQGPILAIFQQPGLFNGDVFTISGNEVYRNNTLIGTVAYSQAPQMAGSANLLAIVSGGALYIYDGATLTQQVYFNDGTSLLPAFSGVSVLYSIFVYPVQGSDLFYYSNVGNPGSLDAASFSVCQTAPDQIVQSYVLAEEIYFFGQTSVEIWDFTGQLNAPFALSQGRTYARGCASQASVRKLDNALFWIGDDFVVYRTTQVPLRISTSFIEDRLRREAALGNIGAVYSLTYQIHGHVVYVINLPYLDESWAFDCQTGQWFQIGTQNYKRHDPGIFLGSCAAGQGSRVFVGSHSDGRVLTFNTGLHSDDGIPIQVVVSGSIWVIGGVNKCTNVSLHCVRGVATATTPHPVVKMRYSDDGGRTFTSWMEGSLGFVGSYNYKATWRGLGIIQQPGRLFEWLVSDSVNVTIEGASYNEARV